MNCVQREISWAQSVAITTVEFGERAFNPDKTAAISEGKQKGRLVEEDSRINPSSSRAIQAEAIKGEELTLAG